MELGRTIAGPLLIAFVGIDGTGKSTQARKLVEWLEERSPSEVVLRRSPKLNEIVLKELAAELFGDPYRYHPGIPPDVRAIGCALDVARFALDTIEPDLDQGRIVVCDRYFQCHLAYFRGAYVTDLEWPEKIMALARRPDLTFLFDGDPRRSQERLLERGDANERELELSELEGARAEYLRLAERFSPTEVVDGSRDRETVAEDVRERLVAWWSRRAAAA